MSEAWVNDNGTWRKPTETWVNHNGTWTKAAEAWVNDNGTWRSVFGGIDFSNMTNSFTTTGLFNVSTHADFNTDGTVTMTAAIGGAQARGSWYTNGAFAGRGDDYEIRMDINSGVAESSDSTGTWLSLNTNRSWGVERSIVGTDTLNCTVTIRLANNSSTEKSETLIITATKEFEPGGEP